MGSGVFTKQVALDNPIRSFGTRQHHKGKMGVLIRVPPYTSPAGKRKRYKVAMRSQTGSTRPTFAGYERGQKEPYATVHLPGQYKVVMPANHVRYVEPV